MDFDDTWVRAARLFATSGPSCGGTDRLGRGDDVFFVGADGALACDGDRLMVRVVCFVLLLCCAGCAPRSSSETTPTLSDADAGPLLDPSALGRQLQIEQRVTARWDDREDSFDAVLMVTKRRLRLVALTPIKTTIFAITLVDGRATFTKQPTRQFPFPPAFIVADVQRAFYPWIAPPPSELFRPVVGQP